MTPVLFLSGNQRSGKTLVQLMLSSHPDVVVSPGTRTIGKLLLGFRRSRPLGPGDLRSLRAAMSADRKLGAWRVALDGLDARARRYEGLLPRDVALDLMGVFRDQTKPGARVLGNKKGFYCKSADLVRLALPEARFVFLMRDGRAAVSSMLEHQPEHDLLSASLMWRLKACRIRQLASAMQDAVRVVRYERLVADPEAVCRELCGFLGLGYAPAMLTEYRRNDAVRHLTDRSHRATFEPVTTAFVDRWRARLAPEQVLAVEAIAGFELRAHGYPLETPAASRRRMRTRYLGALVGDHLAFWREHIRRHVALR